MCVWNHHHSARQFASAALGAVFLRHDSLSLSGNRRPRQAKWLLTRVAKFGLLQTANEPDSKRRFLFSLFLCSTCCRDSCSISMFSEGRRVANVISMFLVSCQQLVKVLGANMYRQKAKKRASRRISHKLLSFFPLTLRVARHKFAAENQFWGAVRCCNLAPVFFTPPAHTLAGKAVCEWEFIVHAESCLACCRLWSASDPPRNISAKFSNCSSGTNFSRDGILNAPVTRCAND